MKTKKVFVDYVNEFAYWDKPLQKNEIKELTDHIWFSYLNDYEQYSSSDNLKIYYDFKHIQLNQDYKYEEGESVDMVKSKIVKVLFQNL